MRTYVQQSAATEIAAGLSEPSNMHQTRIVTELAKLPPDAHLDGEGLAQILGRCKKSIQRATRRGELPPPFKFLGRNVWLVKTILEHMEARQEAACRKVDRRVHRLDRDVP